MPAWELFDNVEALKAQVTDQMLTSVKEGNSELETISKEESLEELRKYYSPKRFDPTYQGTYLDRSVMTAAVSLEDIYGELPARDQIADELRSLYPDALREKMERWRNLSEDVVLLESIENGVLDAPTGIVRHRGRDYKLSELSTLVASVATERDEVRSSIEEDDRKCRAAHHTAARYVARGWQDYHGSLVRMLHYAEHSLAELMDVYGYSNNLFQMSVAAGRPSERRIRKIMDSMNELHAVMVQLFNDACLLYTSPSPRDRG